MNSITYIWIFYFNVWVRDDNDDVVDGEDDDDTDDDDNDSEQVNGTERDSHIDCSSGSDAASQCQIENI